MYWLLTACEQLAQTRYTNSLLLALLTGVDMATSLSRARCPEKCKLSIRHCQGLEWPQIYPLRDVTRPAGHHSDCHTCEVNGIALVTDWMSILPPAGSMDAVKVYKIAGKQLC